MKESVEDFSEVTEIVFFTVLSRKVKDRYRTCHLIGSLIDDIADLEQSVGKALTKAYDGKSSSIGRIVGGQTPVARSDTLVPNFHIASDSMMRHASASKGKLHLSLQTTLILNIGKAFPEHNKSNLKEINNIAVKIQQLYEDTRKSKVQYWRRLDKYRRSIQEAEAAAQARDALIEAEARPKPDTPMDRDSASFVNRSLSKVKELTKMTPGDALKRAADKCRDLVTELDAQEVQLAYQNSHILSEQALLRAELEKALDELRSLDEKNVTFTKDAQSQLLVALDVLLGQYLDIVDSAANDVQNIETSIAFPLRSLSPSVSAACLTEDSLENLFISVDQSVESLDSVRGTLSRYHMCTTDCYEAEKAFVRGVMKVLGKHGYTEQPCVPAVTSTDKYFAAAGVAVGAVGVFVPLATLVADCMGKADGSLLNAAWSRTASAIHDILVSHGLALEVAARDLNENLNPTLARLQSARDLLVDKKAQLFKQDQNLRSNSLRLAQKLAKVQSSLVEKRHEVLRANSGDFAAGELQVGTNSTDAETFDLQSSKIPVGSLTRDYSLTVAVGLETPQERKLRIEAKVTELEEAERDLKMHLQSALQLQKTSADQGTKDLRSLVQTCVEQLNADLVAVAAIFDRTVIKHRKSALSLRTVAQDTLKAWTCIQASDEAQLFYESDYSEYLQERKLQSSQSQQTVPSVGVLDALSSVTRDAASGSVALITGAPSDGSTANVVSPGSQALFPEGLDASDVIPIPAFKPLISDIVESERLVMKQERVGNLNSIPAPLQPRAQTPNTSSPHVSPEKVGMVSTEDNKATGANNSENGDNVGDSIANVSSKNEPPAYENIHSQSQSQQQRLGITTPSANRLGVTSSGSQHPDIDHSSEYELQNFGLRSTDKVVESFSCALYSNKGLGLTQGRLYVTQFFVAFHGWPETRVLLSLSTITSFEKMNTLYYIPNAILLRDHRNDEYFFGSFIDRDHCYGLLTRLAKIAQTVIQLQGPDKGPEHHRNLAFGLQKDSFSDLVSTIQAMAVPPVATQQQTIAQSPRPTGLLQPVMEDDTISDGNGRKENDTESSISSFSLEQSTPLGSTSTPPPPSTQLVSSPVSTPVESHHTKQANSSSAAVAVLRTRALPTVTKEMHIDAYNKSQLQLHPHPQESNAVGLAIPVVTVHEPVNFSTLFRKQAVDEMITQTIPVSLVDVWRTCWKDSTGFSDFLEGEGDFNVSCGNWIHHPKSNPIGAGIANVSDNLSSQTQRVSEMVTVPEDKCGFTYIRQRPCSYMHPRTSMLFIGPKNAPATQTHYLHTPHGTDGMVDNSAGSFLVLTMSKFDGVPLADYFKILQYWAFSTGPDPGTCIVKMGLHIHLLKQTILRSQLTAGVKEELIVLSKRWLIYAARVASTPLPALRRPSLPAAPESTYGNDQTIVFDQSNNSNSNRIETPVKKTPRETQSNIAIELQPSSTPGWLVWSLLAALAIIVIFQLYQQRMIVKHVTDLSEKMDKLESYLKKVANKL